MRTIDWIILVWLLLLTGVAIGIGAMLERWLRANKSQGQGAPAEPARAAEEDLDDAQSPQPVDPQNPPRYKYWTPEEYDPKRAPRCTCHGRPIGYREKVLYWPIPNHPHGAVDIWCAETYEAPR